MKRVDRLRNLNFTWSLCLSSRLGRLMRRQECKSVFLPASCSFLLSSTLGVVYHRRTLLRNLLLRSISAASAQRWFLDAAFNHHARPIHVDCQCDGKLRHLSRKRPPSEFHPVRVGPLAGLRATCVPGSAW